MPSPLTKEELIRLWERPENWSSGVYRCKDDPRVIVPKRTTWGGWTVNFAHPGEAWSAILVSVVVAVGPILGLLMLGVRDLRWLFAAAFTSIALLIWGSYHLSGRTHPEALPKIVLAVAVVIAFGLWACRAGVPWLPGLVVAGLLLYWLLVANRGKR